MLVSRPKEYTGGNNDITHITVNDNGFSINDKIITLKDLITLYFITYGNLPIDKLSNNIYTYASFFFNTIVDSNDKKKVIFNFTNPNLLTGDNIINQIRLLNVVNEQYINNYLSEYSEIKNINLLNFFIDYIYYLVSLLTSKFPKESVISNLYDLSLKNIEILNLLNKQNNIIIQNLQQVINEIKLLN